MPRWRHMVHIHLVTAKSPNDAGDETQGEEESILAIVITPQTTHWWPQ